MVSYLIIQTPDRFVIYHEDRRLATDGVGPCFRVNSCPLKHILGLCVRKTEISRKLHEGTNWDGINWGGMLAFATRVFSL